MGHPTIDDFCAQVCQQVRFRPDHAAIRAELAAHWEDHAAALMERGIPEEEAARRALEAMGDPEEIGKELDKSHSPLLGGFQELFRALVWTALAVLLMALCLRESEQHPEVMSQMAVRIWEIPGKKCSPEAAQASVHAFAEFLRDLKLPAEYTELKPSQQKRLAELQDIGEICTLIPC